MLDIHSRLTRDSTRQLMPEVLARAPGVEAVIYEIMPEALPVLGYQAWADEVERLDRLADGRLNRATPWTSRATNAACAGS